MILLFTHWVKLIRLYTHKSIRLQPGTIFLPMTEAAHHKRLDFLCLPQHPTHTHRAGSTIRPTSLPLILCGRKEGRLHVMHIQSGYNVHLSPKIVLCRSIDILSLDFSSDC